MASVIFSLTFIPWAPLRKSSLFKCICQSLFDRYILNFQMALFFSLKKCYTGFLERMPAILNYAHYLKSQIHTVSKIEINTSPLESLYGP